MTIEEIGFVIEMQKKEREKLSKIIDDMKNQLRETEADRDRYKFLSEMLEEAVKSYNIQYPRDNGAGMTNFGNITKSLEALAKYIAKIADCDLCANQDYCKKIADLYGFDMSYCEFIYEKWLKELCDKTDDNSKNL